MTGRELFVTTAAVDPDFFDVFQTPVLAGRGFAPHDTAVGANTVVVNQLFVDNILAGRNAVGRRIRYQVEDSQAVDGSRNRGRGLKSSGWCGIWYQTPSFP